MSGLQSKPFEPIRVLRDAYGDAVELIGDKGAPVTYAVLSEFALGDTMYAVLQSDKLKRDDDVALYRIGRNDSGEPELETIEDDDEWEDVLEYYDEMTFSFDDEV